MLVFIRHGETNLNGPPGSSEERLRGWLPADLTPKGRRQAEEAGATLKDFEPTSFHTSDLPRALETASIIGKHIGAQATPTMALRDWNTGHMAGQRFPDVKDELFHYIEHPNETVPDGEPLQSYLDRFIPFVKQLVEDPNPHLVVGHARGTQILTGLAQANGQWVNEKPLLDKPIVDPGKSLIVAPDWTTIPGKLTTEPHDEDGG